ncbi:hypothetical protein Sta7437_1570 [Stanieria cyanosphaera PCC 7437]|uniref:DUF4114 domain-containing protein n=1 Tax=Stanieria cyanosphaera (strain ATCC 29371 / PCC 7437) TaxID=111780 RepID=K9XTZ5_STAC7|nr:DUF4114 domain-containing protein [Stanieria cyanosphaera]AFZ35137.1 hypothetical protein Sta7437_1570 [Stanieria cyanosphaera PCC 7437]
MINSNFWTIANESIINPESVYYHPETNEIFVANVVGNEVTKDGQGWLSKISPSGKILKDKWVEGLNAPHGMRAFQGKLWVADIDELVVIDLRSAQIIEKISIPESIYLNDVAIAEDGRVFVSDTITNRIYQVKDGQVTIFAEGKHLESPNGLLIKDNHLFVAGWGNITDTATFATDVPGNIFKLDLTSEEKQVITQSPLGNLDGLEQDLEGNFIVSDYIAGELFVVNPTDKTSYSLISGLEGTADIGLIPDQDLVIVPSLSQSTVTAYQYTPTLSLTQQNPYILQLGGDINRAKLQFQLSSKDVETTNIHELGIFVVDDSEGRINGVLPSQDGYVQAALNRSKTIFSVLPDNFILNPSRIIDNIQGKFLSFYLIENGTTDEVLANPDAYSKVHLNKLPITTIENNQFQINFEDSKSDLALTLGLTKQTLPIGTQVQGQPEGELADLRNLVGQQVQVDVPVIESEAAYKNTVGFYQVENEQGKVIDPITGEALNPGEVGYTQAALRNSQQLGISFTHQEKNIKNVLQGGHLYAPFLIANNTLEQTLASFDSSSDEQKSVYFAYLEANWDKVDHVRLLSDNTWGFEDLAHGGDQDFNDLVIQLSFTV